MESRGLKRQPRPGRVPPFACPRVTRACRSSESEVQGLLRPGRGAAQRPMEFRTNKHKTRQKTGRDITGASRPWQPWPRGATWPGLSPHAARFSPLHPEARVKRQPPALWLGWPLPSSPHVFWISPHPSHRRLRAQSRARALQLRGGGRNTPSP